MEADEHIVVAEVGDEPSTHVCLIAEVDAEGAHARRDARGLFYVDALEKGQDSPEAIGEQQRGDKGPSRSAFEACGVEADLRHGDESRAFLDNDGCPRRDRDEVEEQAGNSREADGVDLLSDCVIARVEGLIQWGGVRADRAGVRIGVSAEVDELLA